VSTEAWPKRNIGKIRKYRRDWYAKNSDHAKAKVTDRRQELKQWFKELKSDMKCNRCPENNPACLDFHHTGKDRKDINIYNAVNRGWSKQRILKEIAKCEILCANCHRKEHHSKFFNQ
jgi:hypothetical protein